MGASAHLPPLHPCIHRWPRFVGTRTGHCLRTVVSRGGARHARVPVYSTHRGLVLALTGRAASVAADDPGGRPCPPTNRSQRSVAAVSGRGLTAARPCTRRFLILGPPELPTSRRRCRRGGSAARRQTADVATDRTGSAAPRGDAPLRHGLPLPPAFTPPPHTSPSGAAAGALPSGMGAPSAGTTPPRRRVAPRGGGGAWRPRPNCAARRAAGGRGSRLRPRHVARAAARPSPSWRGGAAANAAGIEKTTGASRRPHRHGGREGGTATVASYVLLSRGQHRSGPFCAASVVARDSPTPAPSHPPHPPPSRFKAAPPSTALPRARLHPPAGRLAPLTPPLTLFRPSLHPSSPTRRRTRSAESYRLTDPCRPWSSWGG